MKNITRIIISLLIAVMALAACGINQSVKDSTATAIKSSDLGIFAENTCVKETTTTQPTSSETTSAEDPPEQRTSSEAPREPLPPPEESQPTTPVETPTEEPPITEEIPRPLKDLEEEAIRLVNLEREKVGLTPLVVDNTYYNLVKLRADECVEYWSHTRPNGQKWSAVYDGAQGFNGIRKIGENLGKNFKTVEQITQALMNSDGHRAAILGADYTHICIAITVMNEGDGNESLYAITQHFYKRED